MFDTHASLVVEIHSDKEFKEWWKQVCDQMLKPGEGPIKGAHVRVVGWGNQAAENRILNEYIDYVHGYIEYGDKELLTLEEWCIKNGKVPPL